MANLLDRFFGGGGESSGSNLTLMDRFMNPLTQGGLAMIGGRSPSEGAAIGQQYMQNRALKSMAPNASPEELAMMQLSPQAYVAAKLNPKNQGEWKEVDGRLYHSLTGEFKDGAGPDPNKWSRSEIAKEFDLSKYTDESRKAAIAAGDPGLLQPGGLQYNQEQLNLIDKAGSIIEKPVTEIREGMSGVETALRMLQTGGGAADYASIVSFVRATDPGTAAKEGEVAAAEKAQGFMNRIASIALQAEGNNGIIPKAQKEALWDALTGLHSMYQERYEQEIVPMSERLANRFGVKDDADIIRGTPIRFTKYKMPGFKEDPTVPDAARSLIGKAKTAIGMGEDNSEPIILQKDKDGNLIIPGQ